MECLENAIHEFFSYLSVMSKEWAAKAKESESIFVGLKNQSEQLQLINRVTWSQDLLANFPDIQEKLFYKITFGLEDETAQLNDICKTLFDIKKKLDSKLQFIERSSHKVNVACDSSYGAISPPVYKLMEYAEDVSRHYSVLYIQMMYALASLNYADEKNVRDAEEVFHKSTVVNDTISGYVVLWKTLQKH